MLTLGWYDRVGSPEVETAVWRSRTRGGGATNVRVLGGGQHVEAPCRICNTTVKCVKLAKGSQRTVDLFWKPRSKPSPMMGEEMCGLHVGLWTGRRTGWWTRLTACTMRTLR